MSQTNWFNHLESLVRNYKDAPEASIPRTTSIENLNNLNLFKFSSADSKLFKSLGANREIFSTVPQVHVAAADYCPEFAQFGSGPEKPLLAAFVLPDETLLASSTARELSALLQSLVYFNIEQGSDVYWYSDSTAAVLCLTKWRSTSGDVNRLLSLLWDITVARDLRIFAHWVSRDLQWLPAADWLSRVAGRRAQAEWSVDPQYLLEIRSMWHLPRVDLDTYATAANTVAPRYRSRYPELGSEGPALSSPWRGQLIYAFPPFSQIGRCVRQFLLSREAKRLLLVAPWDHNAVQAVRRSGLVVAERQWKASARLIDIHKQPARSPPTDPLGWFLIRH